MQVTARFNQADRVFDSWIIQDCICKKSEYTQYLVRAESDDESASFWVVDFPASAEDLLVLEENGMTASQAVEFFKHAAEDFFGSIQSEKNSENCDCAVSSIRLAVIYES